MDDFVRPPRSSIQTRRQFLAAVGGVSAATAGCTGITGGSGRTQSVRIEYVDVAGVRSEETFQPVLDELEERHGVTIDLDFVEIPYENVRRQLLTRVGGANAPDIAAIDQIWFGEFVDEGTLLPLDDVADDVDFDDYLDAFADVVRHDGRIYGIPTTTDVRGTYWDRQAFEEAGLDPERPPETWSELFDVATELHDSPDRYGAAYLANPGRWSVTLFGAGGQFFDQSGDEPRFHEEPGVAAARFVDRLYNEVGASSPEPTVEDGAELARSFLSGQYAISVVEGSWLEYFWGELGNEEDSIVDRFGFGPAPTPDGEPATMSGGHVWAAFRSTDHPEVVAHFLRVAASREFNRHLAVETGEIPTRRSLLDDEAIWSHVHYADAVRDLLDVTRLRPVRHWPAIDDALSDALQRVAYDRVEPELAMDRAAEHVRSVIG